MIYSLGSINADHVYRLLRLPTPGETLAAHAYSRMLGGKGANQSIAAVRAGARVVHIGALGPDGDWMRDALATAGVDVTHVANAAVASGHAIVMVDSVGENSIVIHPGANRALDFNGVEAALHDARPSDWLLMQNETNCQVEAARMAHGRGMRVAYSAAPFDARSVQAVIPYLTLLILNAAEAAQLFQMVGEVLVPRLLITRGADGAEWRDLEKAETVSIPAFPVHPTDTTGAGDCFSGYTVAGLSAGLSPVRALRQAAAAAALQVQRLGASGAIPALSDVKTFLAYHD